MVNLCLLQRAIAENLRDFVAEAERRITDIAATRRASTRRGGADVGLCWSDQRDRRRCDGLRGRSLPAAHRITSDYRRPVADNGLWPCRLGLSRNRLKTS